MWKQNNCQRKWPLVLAFGGWSLFSLLLLKFYADEIEMSCSWSPNSPFFLVFILVFYISAVYQETRRKDRAICSRLPACPLLLHLPGHQHRDTDEGNPLYQLYCVLLLMAESALACISEARGGGSAVKGGKWFPRRRRPPNQKTKSDKGGLAALRIW